MNEPVFMFDDDDLAMRDAYEKARGSFKFFWRELSWERRRIVPGLEMAAVKLPFSDGPRSDGRPEFEQMWIADVDFDGEELTGQLLNSPNWLTSVQAGEEVRAPFSQLTDWMITSGGRAYGAFTVNVMRSQMGSRERKQHDQAWGVDFGDPVDVRVEVDYGAKPKRGFFAGLFGGKSANPDPPADASNAFRDHPMCVNMLETIDEQLNADPGIARSVDDAGFTLLQRNALAGNFGIVKLLVQHGADVPATTPAGRTAADLARGIGWLEIAEFLDRKSPA